MCSAANLDQSFCVINEFFYIKYHSSVRFFAFQWITTFNFNKVVGKRFVAIVIAHRKHSFYPIPSLIKMTKEWPLRNFCHAVEREADLEKCWYFWMGKLLWGRCIWYVKKRSVRKKNIQPSQHASLIWYCRKLIFFLFCGNLV